MIKVSLAHRIARAEARRDGLSRFIGDLCPLGHRERSTRFGRCCACEKARKSFKPGAVEKGTSQWARLVPVKPRPMQAIPITTRGGSIRPPTKAQLMAGK